MRVRIIKSPNRKKNSGRSLTMEGLLTLVPVGIPTTPNTRILCVCARISSDTEGKCPHV